MLINYKLYVRSININMFQKFQNTISIKLNNLKPKKKKRAR